MTTTDVRQPPALPVLLGLAVLVLGLVLGWFASPLAGGLVGLVEKTPLPVPQPLVLAETLPLGWTLGILGGLGLVGGAFLALSVVGEAPVLTVAGDHLEHRQEEREVWIERSDVGAVYQDKDDLVLLRPDGGLRARLDVDTLSAAKVRAALDRDSWPWQESDPHEQRYERWVDGRPGFTSAEHEVLRRRLEQRKDAVARRAADDELAALGLMVRIRDDRLQVRRTASSGAGTAEDGARGANR